MRKGTKGFECDHPRTSNGKFARDKADAGKEAKGAPAMDKGVKSKNGGRIVYAVIAHAADNALIEKPYVFEDKDDAWSLASKRAKKAYAYWMGEGYEVTLKEGKGMFASVTCEMPTAHYFHRWDVVPCAILAKGEVR